MTEKNSTLFKQKGTTLKKFVAMLLALVMVFALCACGSNGDKAADDNNGDYHLVLKLSHVFQPNEQLTIEMQQVAQRIKERTNGAIEIQCYDSSQLAVYKDNIEQVVNGADWIACEDPSYLADYDIDFEALIGPMMYNSIDEYSYVCQSDLVKNMCQKLEDNYGIHVLALDFNVGMRCMQTNKVIKTPADLKGMKIRVVGSPLFIETFRALGANPVNMNWAESITGFQQGIVDGQENPTNGIIIPSKLWQYHKYMCDWHYLIDPLLNSVNPSVWKQFSAEDQKIITECAALSEKYSKALSRIGLDDGTALKYLQSLNKAPQETDPMAIMKKNGMTVVELTAEQKKAFVDATKSVRDNWTKKIGPALVKAAEEDMASIK